MQKEQTLDLKRQRLMLLLRGMLSRQGFEHPKSITVLSAKTVEQVRNNLIAQAQENISLCTYDTPEKICQIRRFLVESTTLAKLEQERLEMLGTFYKMIGFRGSASPIKVDFTGDKPGGLSRNNCRECTDHLQGFHAHWWTGRITNHRADAERFCHEIVRIEEAIYELKKDPLDARLMRGDPFKQQSLEAIAEYCKFLSTLNTPEKVIEVYKQAYIETEINPLLEKIKVISGQLENSLHDLDAEKSRYDAFYNAAMGVALELEANPIMEGSGQYRDIVRQVQTHSDRQNWIVNKLTHLDRFTAWVKIGNKEYTIATYPLPPRRKVNLSDLIYSIRQRNVADGYLRPVSEVKAEIRARQEMFTQHLTSKQKV